MSEQLELPYTKKHFEQRTEDSFDGWWTPNWVVGLVKQMDAIYLDPCTEECNPTGAQQFFTEGGLERTWSLANNRHGFPVVKLVYVNPPYGSALKAWSNKIANESVRCEILALVPARTETTWFGTLWDRAAAVAFFRKRIRFSHPSKPAAKTPKFPNAMFYFGDRVDAFKEVFEETARVVIL